MQFSTSLEEESWFKVSGNLLKKEMANLIESLIVLKDIGIQVEKKYLTGRKAIDAVDISKLKDIVIHEVISLALRIFF